MIVDAHTHVFPEEWRARREELCARDPLFAEMYAGPRARLATAPELLAEMDVAGIDAAVIAGFAWRDPVLCHQHNNALLDAATASGGRLLPFVAVSLHDPATGEAEVDRCRRLGARGVGELRPEAHGLDLGAPAGADALARVAAGLPLLIHASEPVGHAYPGKGGQSIGPLYAFLSRHPGTVTILAHLGGGLPLYAHMPEVRQALTSAYVDTAAWPLLYQPSIFRATIDLIGADRVLFATDYPLRHQARELRLLESVLLHEEERQAVLGANAARLLGLADTLSLRESTRGAPRAESGSAGAPDSAFRIPHSAPSRGCHAP